MKTNTTDSNVATTRNGMRIKSGVKAGSYNWTYGNHNQTQVKGRLAVKSGVKAGGPGYNHNQTLVSRSRRARAA